MVSVQDYYEKSEILKALAHPYRLCIVKGLIEKECNVSRIQECLGISQSSVSQHLSKLKAAGIIRGKRCGNEICYKVVDQTAVNIVNTIFKAEE
ncbi:MAG: ArsR/SmtB family transcription factor [Bacillota bacterium]